MIRPASIKRIAVLAGGFSKEREVSLVSGAAAARGSRTLFPAAFFTRYVGCTFERRQHRAFSLRPWNETDDPVAVVASLLVIAQRNPVYSVLLLIASFGALSGLYVLLDSPFAAVIQIVVYAGAILVLFLFVVMLLN